MLKRYIGKNERRSYIYNNWKKEVLKRDDYKCQLKNKECNGNLEVHHILSWKEHEGLRYDVNNGITLCHQHHPRIKKQEEELIPIFNNIINKFKL